MAAYPTQTSWQTVQLSLPVDDFCKEKSPLPKLVISGGDGISIARTAHEEKKKERFTSGYKDSYGLERLVSLCHPALALCMAPQVFATSTSTFALDQDALQQYHDIDKDKNNFSRSWLIAFGDLSGGQLWLESPPRLEPPPNPTCDWQCKLRGDYPEVQNRWV